MTAPVLLDASVIVALLHRREEHHARCAAFFQDFNRPLATCEAVITESCFLLRRSSAAVGAVLANIESGAFQIPMRMAESSNRVRFIMQKYREIPSSLADASLITLAEELNTGDILTLDRDFRTYRWGRNRAFRLLLEEQ